MCIHIYNFFLFLRQVGSSITLVHLTVRYRNGVLMVYREWPCFHCEISLRLRNSATITTSLCLIRQKASHVNVEVPSAEVSSVENHNGSTW